MAKNILVTGGAGFLGSNLCATLIDAGHHVTCLDDFSTGRRKNLDAIISHPNFALIEANVQMPIEFSGDLDEIYNLACPASPPKYQADPVDTMRTSILGALNILELAQAKGARVLQASTSEIYGDPLISPQPETYWGHVNPIGIRSCYDEGKRTAETLFSDYHRTRGVDIRIMRIFNTYGPNMDPEDGRVVSNFIIQALKGEPITIYGDGNQTRSFCFVDDLIAGMIALMETEGDLSTPVNIGNENEFTVRELAERVLTLVDTSSTLVELPLPSDDPKQRRPDTTRAEELLGWKANIQLNEGLPRTISYFASELGL